MKSAICLCFVKNPINFGTLIRSGEAFGINEVWCLKSQVNKFKGFIHGSSHLCGTMGALKQMELKQFIGTSDVVEYALKNNYHFVSIELSKDSVKLPVEKYPLNPVFVMGNESKGVPKEVMSESLIVEVPQANTYVRCLNTAVAGSIVIYDWHRYMRERR